MMNWSSKTQQEYIGGLRKVRPVTNALNQSLYLDAQSACAVPSLIMQASHWKCKEAAMVWQGGPYSSCTYTFEGKARVRGGLACLEKGALCGGAFTCMLSIVRVLNWYRQMLYFQSEWQPLAAKRSLSAYACCRSSHSFSINGTWPLNTLALLTWAQAAIYTALSVSGSATGHGVYIA